MFHGVLHQEVKFVPADGANESRDENLDHYKSI